MHCIRKKMLAFHKADLETSFSVTAPLQTTAQQLSGPHGGRQAPCVAQLDRTAKKCAEPGLRGHWYCAGQRNSCSEANMEELTHHPRRLLLVSCVAESCDLRTYGHSHGELRIRNKRSSRPPHTEGGRLATFVEDQLKVNL